MDSNKKFLYFNADSDATNGTEVSATTVPVSTICGIEAQSTSNLKMYFKESVETDTLDVTMARTTNSDPRVVMERIVNEINFSKDSLLVVGDNSTSQFIDESLSSVSISFASHEFIRFTKPLLSRQAQAVAPGAGFSATTYSQSTGFAGLINGEVVTSIFLDLNANTIVSSSDQDDVIGKDDAANAFFTQVTTTVNGVVYAGEIICVEVPTTGDADINVTANTSGTIAEDAAGDGQHTLANCGTQTLGLRTPFTIPTDGIQSDFLYLTHGGTTAGTYGAGKFIVRLFGAPTLDLHDIN